MHLQTSVPNECPQYAIRWFQNLCHCDPFRARICLIEYKASHGIIVYIAHYHCQIWVLLSGVSTYKPTISFKMHPDIVIAFIRQGNLYNCKFLSIFHIFRMIKSTEIPDAKNIALIPLYSRTIRLYQFILFKITVSHYLLEIITLYGYMFCVCK